MDEPRSVRFLGLLRALLRHEVDFFVVGGVAAQLDPTGRHIEPDISKLATLRLHLFLTDLGALDVLGTVGRGLTYQAPPAGSPS